MRFVLVMICGCLLTGCAIPIGTAGTNGSACAVWQEISWSKKDTDQTIGEIKTSNARRQAWCK